jgi:branched-chain amino acid aminotransferase
MRSSEPDGNIIVYFQNQFVRLADAKISILTHALHYGTGVFEGIRGYFDEGQHEMFLLRAPEHFERWRRNCGILRLAIPLDPHELTEIAAELCRRNGFHSTVYIRPLAYKSAARVGVNPDDQDAFSITAIPFGAYLDSRLGLHAGVASWRRVEDNAIPGRAKICGAYVNSALATDEARRNGFDEAIFLTESGHVAEGATCNIFMVRGAKLITPPPTDNILEGITRACVMELAEQELGIEVVERSIDRSELYVCDELFFTGTAVELGPVTRVDHRPVGDGRIGPITDALLKLFEAASRGRMARYRPWLTPVYSNTLTAA